MVVQFGKTRHGVGAVTVSGSVNPHEDLAKVAENVPFPTRLVETQHGPAIICQARHVSPEAIRWEAGEILETKTYLLDETVEIMGEEISPTISP